MSDSLRPHGLYSPWNFPGQNTGVGNPSLLQVIFLTQGLNPGLLHCGQILNQLSHKASCLNMRSEFFSLHELGKRDCCALLLYKNILEYITALI